MQNNGQIKTKVLVVFKNNPEQKRYFKCETIKRTKHLIENIWAGKHSLVVVYQREDGLGKELMKYVNGVKTYERH